MAGQHHLCNEHELEQTLGDAEGQGGLACCSPWRHNESDATGQLNSNSNEEVIGHIRGEWNSAQTPAPTVDK